MLIKRKKEVFTDRPRGRKTAFNWRAWFWGLAAVAVLSGFLYLVIWSPVFKIKTWSVVSSNFTSQAQAQELVNRSFQGKIFNIIPKDNWLVFLNQNLPDKILAAFPEAASVQININILEGVKITVKGRQGAAIWCQNAAAAMPANQATTTADIVLPAREKCFFADNNGLLFREAPEISGIAMPEFFGQPGENFAPGDKVVASSTIGFAADLKKQLRDINVEVLGFMAGAAGNADLVAYTDESWQVYFNASRPAQPQVKILAALLAGDLKDIRAELKYVDLRVAGKVYYK